VAEILSSDRSGEPLHRFLCSDVRLSTVAGERIGGALVSNGTSGVLARGPFSTLVAGSYRVSLNGTMREYGAEGAQVHAYAQSGTVFLGKSALGKADERGLIGTLEFTLDEACTDFELRVIVSDGCKTTLSHVDIERSQQKVTSEILSHAESKAYPVWVILTGIVRDEQSLLDRFKFFHNLKRNGHIEQLVFSTWSGEAARLESVANALKQYEFIVVESDEPDIVCHGHYLHQMVAVENALAVCPDNAFVFKTRTDKAGKASAFFEDKIEKLFKEKQYARPCNDDLGVFQFKIGVSGVYFTEKSTHLPILFFWNDINYFGFKPDILKLLNNNVLSFEFQKLVPEQALFYAHFSHRWPCLDTYFRAINQWETIVNFIFHPERYRAALDTLTQVLVANPVFRRGFLAERYILHRYFFDVVTGFDVELNTKFRGVELRETEEFASVVAPLDNRYVGDPHLSVQVDALVEYFERQFNVTPLRRKITSTGRHLAYTFTTPASKLQVKPFLQQITELRRELADGEAHAAKQQERYQALEAQSVSRVADLAATALSAQQQASAALSDLGLRERDVTHQLAALQRASEEERLEQAREHRRREELLREDFSAQEKFLREQLVAVSSERQAVDRARLEWQEKHARDTREAQRELQVHIKQAAQRERQFASQLDNLRREFGVELDRRAGEWQERERKLRSEFADREEAFAARLALRQREFDLLVRERADHELALNRRLTDLAALELKLGDELRAERQAVLSLRGSLDEVEHSLDVARADRDMAVRREQEITHQLGELRHEFAVELNRRTDEWHEREHRINDRVMALTQIELQLRDEISGGRQTILSLSRSLIEVEQALRVTRSDWGWRLGAVLRKLAGGSDPHTHLLSRKSVAFDESAPPLYEGRVSFEAPQGVVANDGIAESPRSDSVGSRAGEIQQISTELNMQTIGNDSSMSHATPVSSVDDLIQLHDQAFVQQAYQSILGRAADAEGHAYYLRRLRAGVSKISILAQMCRSMEGKAQSVQIEGLHSAIKREARGRLPLVGWIFRRLDGMDGNEPAMRRLRTIENQMGVLDAKIQHRFEQMDRALVTLQLLIAESAQAGAMAGRGIGAGAPNGANGSGAISHDVAGESEQSGAGVFELSSRGREIYFALKTVNATTIR
jgi:Domain of unknown function (DUF4214)